MLKIKFFKFKTTVVSYISKLVGSFNRNIEGIQTKYNLHYSQDKKQYHTLDIMCPESAENLPCVLYLHGGGWTAYDKRVFRSTCKRLAKCGAVVFNCNFSLAPKFHISDMLKDIEDIFSFIQCNAEFYGGDKNRIILAGDSAGAHLHSMFVCRAINGKKEQYTNAIKACAFFYGVYDLVEVKNTDFKLINIYLDAFVPKKTPNYMQVLSELSPINLVTEKHPPTLICSGEIDKLHKTQSAKYIQALKQNCVKVKELIFSKDYKKAEHRFITFDKNEAAKQSFLAFKEFIKEI